MNAHFLHNSFSTRHDAISSEEMLRRCAMRQLQFFRQRVNQREFSVVVE